MTPIRACRETKELWTEMARFVIKERRPIKKDEVVGPCRGYKNHCPCCEYTKREVGSITSKLCWIYCPMNVEWIFYTRKYAGMCEGLRSPYIQWCRLCTQQANYRNALCIDVEFFCLLIAEMAEEAIERLIAESQPKMAKDKDIEYV